MLMACAPDGQRRPGLAQAADLIRGGLRMRLCPSVPRSARTVRAAVRLMHAGAAVSAINLVIVLVIVLAHSSPARSALRKEHPAIARRSAVGVGSGRRPDDMAEDSSSQCL
ncbi:MAG: hypothetical protein ACRDRJ_32515 [Streptosporangiaceae bacterium]